MIIKNHATNRDTKDFLKIENPNNLEATVKAFDPEKGFYQIIIQDSDLDKNFVFANFTKKDATQKVLNSKIPSGQMEGESLLKNVQATVPVRATNTDLINVTVFDKEELDADFNPAKHDFLDATNSWVSDLKSAGATVLTNAEITHCDFRSVWVESLKIQNSKLSNVIISSEVDWINGDLPSIENVTYNHPGKQPLVIIIPANQANAVFDQNDFDALVKAWNLKKGDPLEI